VKKYVKVFESVLMLTEREKHFIAQLVFFYPFLVGVLKPLLGRRCRYQKGLSILLFLFQIIHGTWAPAAYHMLIASDVEDSANGTVTLPNGNIDLCHRNLAIIK